MKVTVAFASIDGWPEVEVEIPNDDKGLIAVQSDVRDLNLDDAWDACGELEERICEILKDDMRVSLTPHHPADWDEFVKSYPMWRAVKEYRAMEAMAENAPPSCGEVLAGTLRLLGFDGLWNPDEHAECGCRLNDDSDGTFPPCGGFQPQCQPGYLQADGRSIGPERMANEVRGRG